VKQHTSPFEQLAESVQERDAPPWHLPVAVQVEVAPPPSPPSRAQHTWVPDSQVELPHAMPPLLDAEPPLDVEPDPPLLDPEPPPDVDPDPPLLDPEPPLDVDPGPPPFELEAPLEPDTTPPLLPPELPEEDVTPPLDPEPLVDASKVASGLRSSELGPSSPDRPHPAARRAAKIESVLMVCIGGKQHAAGAPQRALRPLQWS
jgi:type VI secretion system secreted protein VgrG